MIERLDQMVVEELKIPLDYTIKTRKEGTS